MYINCFLPCSVEELRRCCATVNVILYSFKKKAQRKLLTWSDRTTAPAFLLVTRFLFLDGLFFTHTKNLTSLACSCTTHCLWNSVIELLCSKSESGCKDKKFSNLLPNFPEFFFNQPENHQKQPDSLPESGCKSRHFFITEQIYQTLF